MKPTRVTELAQSDELKTQVFTVSQHAGRRETVLTAPDGTIARLSYEVNRLGKRYPVQTLYIEATSGAGTEYVVTVRRTLQPVGGKITEMFSFKLASEHADEQKLWQMVYIAGQYERDRSNIVETGKRIAEALRSIANDIDRETERFDALSKNEQITPWSNLSSKILHDVNWAVSNLGVDRLVSDEIEWRAEREKFFELCTSKLPEAKE